jgi:predicted enzyme related to lactoylglutathione lyase
MSRFVDSRGVLAVQDLAKSTQFYLDVLGFRRDPVDAKGWSFLSKDAFKLMLGECADEIPAAEVGNHSWFTRVMVEGLDEYFNEVSERGAEVISKPTDRAYGLREFVIRTPDGHRLMFAQRLEVPPNSQSLDASPDVSGLIAPSRQVGID